MENKFEKPTPVSNVDLAFPAHITPLMPPMDQIPPEFNYSNMMNGGGNQKWFEFQQRWFFYGLSKVKIVPKAGINTQEAMRHLSAIQGSFEPKHEHKVAAVAYLASLWFKDWSVGS